MNARAALSSRAVEPVLSPGLPARLARPEVAATLGPAALAWAAILGLPAGGIDLGLCAAPAANASEALGAAWALELAGLRPAARLAEWGLMVVAMMLPTLAPNLGFVRGRVYPADRAGAGAAFLAGYVGVWMAAGVLFLPAVPAFRAAVQAATGGPGAPAVYLLAGALWILSPWRLRALARCHFRPVLACRGRPALAASARFGAGHGLRCAVTCLPLMLALQAAGAGVPGMALATAVILSERAAHRPAPAAGAALFAIYGLMLSPG